MSNVWRYGRDAWVLIRSRADRPARVEMIVIDAGPGMDVDAMLVDGRSTGGSLGLGLGIVQRLSSRFEVYSLADRGTVTVVAFAARSWLEVGPPDVDGLARPITGETSCGDSWSAARSPDRIVVLLADGLGHGPLAAEASAAARAAFEAHPLTGPAQVLNAVHEQLHATRGAAVSVADVDRAAGSVRFAGVGNVVGRVIGPGRGATLAPQPGIVGQRMAKVREIVLPVARNDLVVLHSDGLTAKWHVDALKGVLSRSPTVIAAVLLREAGVRHDDASVAVLRVTS
jgi:hypothetical protein